MRELCMLSCDNSDLRPAPLNSQLCGLQTIRHSFVCLCLCSTLSAAEAAIALSNSEMSLSCTSNQLLQAVHAFQVPSLRIGWQVSRPHTVGRLSDCSKADMKRHVQLKPTGMVTTLWSRKSDWKTCHQHLSA